MWLNRVIKPTLAFADVHSKSLIMLCWFFACCCPRRVLDVCNLSLFCDMYFLVTFLALQSSR